MSAVLSQRLCSELECERELLLGRHVRVSGRTLWWESRVPCARRDGPVCAGSGCEDLLGAVGGGVAIFGFGIGLGGSRSELERRGGESHFGWQGCDNHHF